MRASTERRGHAHPQLQHVGAPGRSGSHSGNTLMQQRLGWCPSITLEEGLHNTYKRIFDHMSEGVTPVIR